MTSRYCPEKLQKVYLSRTGTGVPGFFTGRTLVISLGEREWQRAMKDPEFAKELAKKHNFEYEHNLG